MKNKDTRLYDFAVIIRNIRISQGYNSAEKFATDHGLNRSVYQRWENGEDMNLSSFLRLLELFGISGSDLFSKWESINEEMPRNIDCKMSLVAEAKKKYKKG